MSLDGRWTHSFEEDEGGVRVYRPSDSFAFPPSRRGRETLEFGNAGQVATGMPGPDDRRQWSDASVTSLGMNRYRIGGDETMGGRVVELIEDGPEVLKLRFV